MSNKVSITKSKLDNLAVAVSAKSGEAIPLTIDEMTEAVRSINTSGTVTLQEKSVTPTETAQNVEPDEGYDGLSKVAVGAISSSYVGTAIPRRTSEDMSVSLAAVTAPAGYYATSQSKSVTTMTLPSGTESQLIGTSVGTITQPIGSQDAYLNIPLGYNTNAHHYVVSHLEEQALPSAMSGTAVGTLKATVQASPFSDQYLNVPIGYNDTAVHYKFEAAGHGGVTVSASKSAVANHTVYITPSATCTAGIISNGTQTGQAVSVSASELVGGTYAVNSSGTKDVTNYASASVPSGTAGTPSASKGTVSNHSVTVTPSVTNSTGWITGSTKTGTAVTVSASELVSGSETKTSNGTYDVTNLAEVVVDVSGGTPAISVVDTTDSAGGTIRTITALDISDTTAVASDVASGKYFYTAQGQRTAGTGSGGSPSATQHAIYFEFSDSTNTTINAWYNDSFISNAITATTPTTYNNKTVTLAQLDGTTWYEPQNIPLNTELIDFTKVVNGYVIDGTTGEELESQWSSCSDYTVIDPTMTFSYIGYRWYYIGFYDSSKTFISSIYMANASGTLSGDYLHGTLSGSDIPSNAMYIRISTNPTNPSSSQLSLIRTA